MSWGKIRGVNRREFLPYIFHVQLYLAGIGAGGRGSAPGSAGWVKTNLKPSWVSRNLVKKRHLQHNRHGEECHGGQGCVVILLQIPSVHRGESSEHTCLSLRWGCQDWAERTPVGSSGQSSSGKDHSFEHCQRWCCRRHSGDRRACKGGAPAISHPVWPSRWVTDAFLRCSVLEMW